MPSSFQNVKDLKFVITLSIGSFSDPTVSSGYPTLTLQGLRASAHVQFAGGAIAPNLQAQIYGMTASDMNAATTLNWDPEEGTTLPDIGRNTIAVYAIDGTQETQIFFGNIVQAWGIYAGMPEVYLMVQAAGFYKVQLTPEPRYTLLANTDIATVMEQIAIKAGMIFENNGVVGTVRAGQTLSGSAIEQAHQMEDAYRNQFRMDLDSTSGNLETVGTLAITPPNMPRQQSGTIPLISAQTGLINYPMFYGSGQGVQFDTLFNPAIKFGGAVQIQSAIPKANGTRYVSSITHDLESQTPGGQWKSTVNAVYTPTQLITTSPAAG